MMKTCTRTKLRRVWFWGVAGLLACGQVRAANSAEAQKAAVAPAPVAAAAAVEPGVIRLNFRGASLDDVLDQLSKAAGFVVVKEATVSGTVDVWSHQPLNRDEAVALLDTVLQSKGLAAVRSGRTLRIVSRDQAKIHDLPVRTGADPEAIPRNDSMVTQIIPVRYADATKILDNIQPMLASYATISANASSNAVVLTDTQTNVRRIASVIQALDTSIATVAEIRVFSLQYADAEELAEVVGEVFQAESSNQSSSDPRSRMQQMFMRMRGGGRGQPGGAAGGDTQSEDARAASTKVTAVGDEHSNCLVVNAPADVIDSIAQLVAQVDVATEDAVSLRVFPLRYADSEDIADSIEDLFGEDSSDSRQQQVSQQGRGGRMGGPGAPQTTATDSSRALDEAEVSAVPDTRTNSVVVMASAETMTMIADMVERLDATPENVSQVYVYRIQHADLEALQEMLEGMFEELEDTTDDSSAARAVAGAGQARSNAR